MAVRSHFRGARTRARGLAAAALALGLVATAPALSAAATEPVDLGSSRVYDQVGALTPAEEHTAQSRIEKLRTATGLDLWVVFVDEFTNPSDSETWANDTAHLNGLGPSQYLLAVGVEARQVYLSADPAGPLDAEQVTSIEQDRVIPVLQEDDWAGAVDATARGIEQADRAGSGGGANPSAADPPGNALTVVLVVVAVLAVAAVIVVLVVRARRKTTAAASAEPAGAPPVPTEQLARLAASALIDTDDAIRTSEQELGFATAQFGEGATADFSAALQSARELLAQAFTLQQQLDDDVPDTEEQVRAWNTQIAQLCTEANTGLDDKAEAFDELRQLEADAPAALARARDARTAAAALIDAAAARLTELQRSYAPEALETVDDNVDQARARIAFADEQLTSAQTALTAGDTGEAAVGIRAAEEATGQAVVLAEAIGTLATGLAEAVQQATSIIEGVEQDVRTALTLPDPDGRIAAAVEVTRGDLDAARSALAGTQRRPLHTLVGLQAADQRIDEVVQSVRDAAAQEQRVGQQLAAQLAQAQAQVSAAESFVAARRGAVGSEARTRLAEAGAALARAQQLQSAEPAQALGEAQRANDLAGQAIQYARSDVGGFSGGLGLGGGGGSGGSSFVGALLGGILSNGMLGGGRSSRSYGGGLGGFGGGSTRRSSSGRSGFGASSRRSGSFGGGGGSRGRRGGGRF